MHPIKIQHREKVDTITDIETLTTLRLLGINSASLNAMLSTLPVTLWIQDDAHTIVYGNPEFRENFRTCLHQRCHQCLRGEESACSCCLSKKIVENEKTARCNHCKRGKYGYDINIIHQPITTKSGHTFILHSSRHLPDLRILAECLYPEMQNSNEEKKFLVMCAACKKARDEDDNWVTINSKVLDYFTDRVSHGICPDCIKVLYPWLEDDAGSCRQTSQPDTNMSPASLCNV